MEHALTAPLDGTIAWADFLRDGELAFEQVAFDHPLWVLYSSGTTGLPKAAIISHRAMIARSVIARTDGSFFPDRTFVAWTPLFHRAAAVVITVDPDLAGLARRQGAVAAAAGLDGSAARPTMASEAGRCRSR